MIMTLLPAQRRQEILRAVRGGSAHVADLAESFGVSEMTVRRDLSALARDGKLERVHGGALGAGGEPGFAQIEVERFDVKDRMGAAAAALVEDGQTVMIDIGTSTLQMARHLHGRKVTVVTTNLAVLEELLPDPAIELVLPGGTVRRNYRSLVGGSRGAPWGATAARWSASSRRTRCASCAPTWRSSAPAPSTPSWACGTPRW